MTINDVLARLAGVKAAGSGYKAKCPAHQDYVASLSIGKGDGGKVLLHCHAGCGVQAIVDALGLTMADLMGDHPAKVVRFPRVTKAKAPVVGSGDGPPKGPGLWLGPKDTPEAWKAAMRALFDSERTAAIAAANESRVKVRVQEFLQDVITDGTPLTQPFLRQVAKAYAVEFERVCEWAHDLISEESSPNPEEVLAQFADFLILHRGIVQRAALLAVLQKAPMAKVVSSVTLEAIADAALSGAW